jgi:predicted dehydrogenase
MVAPEAVVTLRLGVVGVGDVAQRDYLPELDRLGGRVELVAVAARTEERARTAAERFGAGRWTTSWRELVEADDVDAIVNLTPFDLHVEVTLGALECGKHVYSEKPLAPSAADATRILKATRERGLRVVAAPSVLLFPQVRRAREIVRSDTLGPIHSAHGRGFGGIPPWEGYLSDPTPYFAPGGGPLLDMAVYPLHALTGLLGPVRRVASFAAQTRDRFTVKEGPFTGSEIPVKTADEWQILVELESGCIACVEASNTSDFSIAPELELLGERGALGLSLLDVAVPLTLVDSDGTRSIDVPHERDGGPDHLLGIEHLADCVERSLEPVASVEHARHVIDVIEAARRSAETGEAQNVTSSFSRSQAADSEVLTHGR